MSATTARATASGRRATPVTGPRPCHWTTRTVGAGRRPVCLIHVGYRRTGSSFLQTELFPLIPDCAVTSRSDEAESNVANSALSLAILTDEGLAGELDRDTPHVAAELAQRFPGARILIGIRSQYAIMRGAYHLHVKSGATDSYKSFVRSRCGQLFDYAGTVNAYRALFGRDKVFVLLHEDLSRDPVASMAAILRFAGADPALQSESATGG